MKLDIGKMIKILSSVGTVIWETTKHLHFNHFTSGYHQKRGKKKPHNCLETDGNGVVFSFLSGSHLMFCFSGRKSAFILNAPFALRWRTYGEFLFLLISQSRVKPNKTTEAPHRQLYVNFMQNADSYSFFLKHKIKFEINN